MRRSHGRRIGGPRSSRTRSDLAMRATGWTMSDVTTRVLKGLYSDIGPIPKYAKLAYERGWITFARYLQIPNEPGPTFKDLLYAESPLFSMIKRHAPTTEPEATMP